MTEEEDLSNKCLSMITSPHIRNVTLGWMTAAQHLDIGDFLYKCIVDRHKENHGPYELTEIDGVVLHNTKGDPYWKSDCPHFKKDFTAEGRFTFSIKPDHSIIVGVSMGRIDAVQYFIDFNVCLYNAPNDTITWSSQYQKRYTVLRRMIRLCQPKDDIINQELMRHLGNESSLSPEKMYNRYERVTKNVPLITVTRRKLALYAQLMENWESKKWSDFSEEDISLVKNIVAFSGLMRMKREYMVSYITKGAYEVQGELPIGTSSSSGLRTYKELLIEYNRGLITCMTYVEFMRKYLFSKTKDFLQSIPEGNKEYIKKALIKKLTEV